MLQNNKIDQLNIEEVDKLNILVGRMNSKADIPSAMRRQPVALHTEMIFYLEWIFDFWKDRIHPFLAIMMVQDCAGDTITEQVATWISRSYFCTITRQLSAFVQTFYELNQDYN